MASEGKIDLTSTKQHSRIGRQHLYKILDQLTKGNGWQPTGVKHRTTKRGQSNYPEWGRSQYDVNNEENAGKAQGSSKTMAHEDGEGHTETAEDNREMEAGKTNSWIGESKINAYTYGKVKVKH